MQQFPNDIIGSWFRTETRFESIPLTALSAMVKTVQNGLERMDY